MLTHNKRLVTITLDIMCYDDLHPEDVNWREVLDLEPGEEFQCRIKEHEMNWQCASSISVTYPLAVRSAWGYCYLIGQKTIMFPEIFDYETNYYWGELVVRLVPMFGFKKYKAQENELLWVYDTNNPDNGYHVPARNLSTYKY